MKDESVEQTALEALRSAADRARDRYDYAAAIGLYTEAIDLARASALQSDSSGLRPPAREADHYSILCDLLFGRAECYDWLYQPEAQLADLAEAQRLAEAAGDVPRQAMALIKQQWPLLELGRQAESLAQSERGLSLARQIGDRQLEVEAVLAAALARYFGIDLPGGFKVLRPALDLARDAGFSPGGAPRPSPPAVCR